ncbi:hypothetical protein O1W69_02665 [Chlamydia sp. 12-01]|uniref:hypothetical protein n=1 Tax=Chlamydia sp. 12-01 TaxID=3002742 RepID=UPI0035D48493
MNGVSSPTSPEKILTNSIPMHRFEKCLLSHTTAVAIGIVIILANLIALTAYASSLPILCSVLLFAFVLIGIVLITVGAKYVLAYPSKIDFMDSSERHEYRTAIQKLLSEIQDLQDKILKQKRYMLDMEKDIETLIQGRLADKEYYIEKMENLQFEMDEQYEDLEKYVQGLQAHMSVLEKERDDWENRRQEEIQANLENTNAYEEELQKMSRKLYKANKMIELQRLQIQELRDEIHQAKERVKLMDYVHVRLARELQGSRNQIAHLQGELSRIPQEIKEKRSRSMSF